MKFYDTLNINRNLLIFNFKILILFVLFLQTPGYSTENPGSFADLAEKLTPSVFPAFDSSLESGFTSDMNTSY